MGFIGVQPTSAPLTSSDITDGIISTAKIADDAVTGAKIENTPSIANGLTLTDGNLVVASGHGLDFSANTGVSGMTSELLDSYEEGSWTPTIGNFTVNSGTWGATGRYVKVGNAVTVTLYQTGGNVTWTASKLLQGLPFAPTNSLFGVGTWVNGSPNAGGQVLLHHTGNIYFANAGSSQTELLMTATYVIT